MVWLLTVCCFQHSNRRDTCCRQGLPLVNECMRRRETRSTGWIPQISVSRRSQLTPANAVCEWESFVCDYNEHTRAKDHRQMTTVWKLSVFTLETVRSVISCSKARVSSACFWLCSAIFSLNFLGFEPPAPGEPDIVRAAILQLQLLQRWWEKKWKKVLAVYFVKSLNEPCWEPIRDVLSIADITCQPKLIERVNSAWLEYDSWVCCCKRS